MKLSIAIRPMPAGSHIDVGHFGGHEERFLTWQPLDELKVHEAKQAHNYVGSNLVFFYTLEYAKYLLRKAPDLYIELHDIKPGTHEYNEIQAYRFAKLSNPNIEPETE